MALGCAGMSVDDFCRCTPSEFDEVMRAWHAREERAERRSWEQVRAQCLFALQPYSKKALEAKDIMRFAWDAEEEKAKAETLSREEIMARYAAALSRRGLRVQACRVAPPAGAGDQLRRDESETR